MPRGHAQSFFILHTLQDIEVNFKHCMFTLNTDVSFFSRITVTVVGCVLDFFWSSLATAILHFRGVAQRSDKNRVGRHTIDSSVIT